MPFGQLRRQFLYPPWCPRVQGTLRTKSENINIGWGRCSSVVLLGTAHFFSTLKCCMARERAPAITSGRPLMCPSNLMSPDSQHCARTLVETRGKTQKRLRRARSPRHVATLWTPCGFKFLFRNEFQETRWQLQFNAPIAEGRSQGHHVTLSRLVLPLSE